VAALPTISDIEAGAASLDYGGAFWQPVACGEHDGFDATCANCVREAEATLKHIHAVEESR
jgi:hypothetical protein